jgi:hypothetical protein
VCPHVLFSRSRGGRECAKGKHVLLAVETVTQTPELAAVGLDEKVQSTTVGRLVLGAALTNWVRGMRV